ncbi:MAG: hypothetical protein AAGN15_09290 [Cyanobacteria bacterium J06581_3]
MQPKFSTLLILTVVSVLLLVPFTVSSIYIDALRDQAFDMHQFLRGEMYKQGTGYAALVLVFIEMLLTARKRSRSWPIKIKMPGSVMIWRSAHIFTGVALLAMVLIHTIGSRGINYNAVLLVSFVGVTLTAMVGVLAETGVLESPRKVFSFGGFKKARSNSKEKDSAMAEAVVVGGAVASEPVGMGKGALIRAMRAVWLQSHIFLVSVFGILLTVHIFLVYYYQ